MSMIDRGRAGFSGAQERNRRVEIARSSRLAKIMRLLDVPEDLLQDLIKLPVNFGVRPGPKGMLCDLQFGTGEAREMAIKVVKSHGYRSVYTAISKHEIPRLTIYPLGEGTNDGSR